MFGTIWSSVNGLHHKQTNTPESESRRDGKAGGEDGGRWAMDEEM